MTQIRRVLKTEDDQIRDVRYRLQKDENEVA